MAVKIKTQYGDIDITNNVIATVVGGAATDIYGIVGMASKNQISIGALLSVKKKMAWQSTFILFVVMALRSQKFAVMFKVK